MPVRFDHDDENDLYDVWLDDVLIGRVGRVSPRSHRRSVLWRARSIDNRLHPKRRTRAEAAADLVRHHRRSTPA